MNEVQKLQHQKTCCNLSYEVNFKVVGRGKESIGYLKQGELEAVLETSSRKATLNGPTEL